MSRFQKLWTLRSIPILAGAATALGLIGGEAAPATAQEDFRAADLDRPLMVEDAYPIKFREWEVETGFRAGMSEVENEIEGLIELKTGVVRNLQAGVELHGGTVSDDADDPSGLESATVHILYNANRETWSRPALSARVEVETPGAGDLGREAWGLTVKGLATRSFHRLRIHANAGYTAADRDDGGDFWRAGLAFDYPLGLFSRAVLGDVYAEIPTGSEAARVWTTVGSRWQLTNLTVLDFGAGTRVDRLVDGEADVQLVVGVSRVFGVPGLIDVPAYPSPRID